jgi:ketosteroid isomerase-like protein
VSETDPDTLRRSYEALNRGDVDAALEALDDDAVWQESPELPGGDEFQGKKRSVSLAPANSSTPAIAARMAETPKNQRRPRLAAASSPALTPRV